MSNAKFFSAMSEFGLTQSALGEYAGQNSARVSRAIKNIAPFTPQEWAAIDEYINAMRSLQRRYDLPIAFSQVALVKPKVDELVRQGRDRVDPPAPPRLAYVFVEAAKYFQIFNNEQPVFTPNYQQAAAFLNITDADQVAQCLIYQGYRHREVQVIALTHQRRMSQVISNVAQVGLVPEPASVQV